MDHHKSVVKNLKADNRRLTLMNSQLSKRVARLEELLIQSNGDPADDCKKKIMTPVKRKRADTGVSYDTVEEDEETKRAPEELPMP